MQTRTYPQPAGLSLYASIVLASAIGPLALNMYLPSMPGLVAYFNTSPGMVQLTLSLYLVAIAISQLIYGPLSDRFGRRFMMLVGISIFITGSFICIWATTIETLIIARLAQAFGASAGIILSRAIVRDLHDAESTASVLGYVTMAWVVLPMIAPSLGGFLEVRWGWRSIFWFLTFLGFVSLLLSWAKLPETNQNLNMPSSNRRPYLEIIKIPIFRRATILLTGSSLVFFSFIGGAPYIMINVLGQSPLEYGMWFVLTATGYMLGNFTSARLAKKLGIERMILIGTTSSAIGGTAMLAITLSGYLSPFWLFACMSMATFGNGTTIPSGTAMALSADSKHIGAATGLAGFAQISIGALITQILGFAQTGYPLIAIWSIAVFAILTLVFYTSTCQQGSIYERN